MQCTASGAAEGNGEVGEGRILGYPLEGLELLVRAGLPSIRDDIE